MSGAFFYEERKGMFVVVVLAIWFVLLGVFGRYLPANASVNKKQMIVNINGNEVLSHWIKEDGRWKFHKISKILKVKKPLVRQAAVSRAVAPAINTHMSGPLIARRPQNAELLACVPPMPGLAPSRQVATHTMRFIAPATTASVKPYRAKKIDKKAMRVQLAKEIGSWAKIGSRWEWKKSAMTTGAAAASSAKDSSRADHQQARWIRRNGVWMFESIRVHDLLIRI